RPDLPKVVISLVPFVDVLNTMLDDTLPLTVGEYLEWGNPNIAEQYAVMRTYCPYTNLEAKDYPATLVRTSLSPPGPPSGRANPADGAPGKPPAVPPDTARQSKFDASSMPGQGASPGNAVDHGLLTYR
ncbi:MAG: hypothetical protein EOO40_04435, partial [Deltaproteobacteria bacterium]